MSKDRKSKGKKVLKIVRNFFIVLLCLLVLGIVVNGIITAVNKGKYSEYYGELVTSSHGKINCTFLGDSGDTIVLLPGLGTASPHYEFMPLAEKLSVNHKVIIIEPLGYGLSDDTDADRTSENICFEIHEVLSSLVEEKYYIMGHSMSGIYALDYANRYTDEVMGFIGLDASVPAQINEQSSMDMPVLMKVLSFLTVKSGYTRLQALILSGLPDETLLDGQLGQTSARCFAGLSQEEKKVWVEIISSRTLSNPMIDEMHRSDENFEAEMTMRFPETVPVLYILAEDTCNTMENWKSMHEDLTADNPASKIVVLQGNHYIHHCDPEGVVSLTEEWMTR